jgi:lipopolysaccharide transport system ATP-binding protein
MGDVSKGEGRTVLFVSHDLSAVSTITNKCILMHNGTNISFGDSSKVINQYANVVKENINYEDSNFINSLIPRVKSVNVSTSEGGMLHANKSKLTIEFEIYIPTNNYKNLALSCQIMSSLNTPVIYSWNFDKDQNIVRNKGVYKISLLFDKLRLYKGSYYIKVHLANTKIKNKVHQYDS